MPRSSKRIRISGPAGRDLAGISTYTRKEWGKRQRDRYLADIRHLFTRLRDVPGMGVDRSDIDGDLRSHPVGQHIVYYRDTRTALVIVRVLHQRMDPNRHLGQDRDETR